ncbi:DUF2061 domain-containing protein [Meridianimarinicoccus aquatilis]|uniref:DUF2061 domain-containing protein n=1 Tax=Meridianimarinicoccus aquatilis TaxID=2552766 RepID=A0A4R6AVU3_9RHOB|nr:DUF2061 domain-containing protein [Fluviibacterium aquatile]QIE41565.1 DUF2061 domain-containing protein [Rhodobacteraceae bacterium SC52]TDL86376.1 DUF2061 domain-containing protein [Fluviibacterium aquatile]
METPKRTFLKALTWQVLGLAMMTLIGLAVTGSVQAGGSIALISALTSLGFYILHERIWARISWGRSVRDQPSSTAPISSSKA